MSTLRIQKSRLIRALATVLGATLLAACASAPVAPPEASSQLAPTGKLRVGLLLSNPSYVAKDGAPGEMQGVGVEIGRELARRLNVAFEPVRYKNVASLLAAARREEWDVAPIGYSRERTADFDFTAIYMIGQMKYLVPTGSAIRSVADVDTSGHRVAVPRGSVQEQYLRGNLKRAQFILVSTNSEALELLGSGKAHAYLNSGNTMNDAWLAKRPGFRLVEGGVAGAGSALAVAKGRPAGLAYAREFVEHLKASGFIQQAIERNGLRSVVAQRGDAE